MYISPQAVAIASFALVAMPVVIVFMVRKIWVSRSELDKTLWELETARRNIIEAGIDADDLHTKRFRVYQALMANDPNVTYDDVAAALSSKRLTVTDEAVRKSIKLILDRISVE